MVSAFLLDTSVDTEALDTSASASTTGLSVAEEVLESVLETAALATLESAFAQIFPFKSRAQRYFVGDLGIGWRFL
ncbi:MAG TPA: hypothetical protein PKH72_07185, partial [Rhodoferax sp.]|nr:hypothetical protein [Rhodoferax sp.]